MTDTNPTDTLTSEEALAMRQSILDAGLDFRDVYTELGIEVETQMTNGQQLGVKRRISKAIPPTDTPVEATEDAPKTLLTALHAVQAEIPDLELTKDATNPAFKSKYLTLDKLMSEVLPLLNRHGLVWITKPAKDGDGSPILYYELHLAEAPYQQPEGTYHYARPEVIGGTFPLLLDKQNSQGLGSALTYAKRQSIMAVLSLTAGEDDDGAAASTSEVPSRKMKTEEYERLVASIQDAGLDFAEVLSALDLKIGPMTLAQGKLVKAYIEEHGNA